MQTNLAVLLVLSLPLVSFATQSTELNHFALYKNTHFGPCSTSAPINATLPIADTDAGSLPNNASLSTTAFCNRFWNYTVLPSSPAAGAYSLSWTNTLTNVIVYALCILSALTSNTKARDSEYDYSSPGDNIDMTPGAKRGILRAPPSNAGFIVKAKHALWWPLLLYVAVEMVLWWISFIIVLVHPRNSHPMLSPLASLTTTALYLSWYVELETEWYKRLRWPVIVVGLLQLIGSGIALVLFYVYRGTADQYHVSPAFDLSPFAECDIRPLLRDPTNSNYLVSLGSSPILFTYGLWVLLMGLMASMGFKVKVVSFCIVLACALMPSFRSSYWPSLDRERRIL